MEPGVCVCVLQVQSEQQLPARPPSAAELPRRAQLMRSDYARWHRKHLPCHIRQRAAALLVQALTVTTHALRRKHRHTVEQMTLFIVDPFSAVGTVLKCGYSLSLSV